MDNYKPVLVEVLDTYAKGDLLPQQYPVVTECQEFIPEGRHAALVVVRSPIETYKHMAFERTVIISTK